MRKLFCINPTPRETVVTDNVVDTFTVQIRSLQGVAPEQVKRQLQKLWEVTHCEATSGVIVAR